jgi:hypothetical protein
METVFKDFVPTKETVTLPPPSKPAAFVKHSKPTSGHKEPIL